MRIHDNEPGNEEVQDPEEVGQSFIRECPLEGRTTCCAILGEEVQKHGEKTLVQINLFTHGKVR
jgi:hypothetical protein